MGRGAAPWEDVAMGFDENPPSPDKLVDTRKRTTKVNLAVAFGVVIFLAIGVFVLVRIALTQE
jgi:hypothetical protein